MLGMMIAYDADDNVVGTLDFMVRHDPDTGAVIGLVDFIAHEEAGGEHTDNWGVSHAVGSKAWPEWIGGKAHQFRVERTGPPGAKRITALVHKVSGHRRERAAIEAAIAARIAAAGDGPADIRDLVGGPDRPMLLDETGRNRPGPRPPRPTPL